MTPRPSGAWATVLDQCSVPGADVRHPSTVAFKSDDRVQRHNVGCIERAATAAADGKLPEYDDVRSLWLVPSLSGRNRARYQVHVLSHPDQRLASAACNCEAGHEPAAPGSTPCWHGAAAMIEAQLLDLVEFDGRVWRLTAVGQAVADAAADKPRTLMAEQPKMGTPDYERMVSAFVD